MTRAALLVEDPSKVRSWKEEDVDKRHKDGNRCSSTAHTIPLTQSREESLERGNRGKQPYLRFVSENASGWKERKKEKRAYLITATQLTRRRVCVRVTAKREREKERHVK